MATVINLGKARKQRQRTADAADAAMHRVQHGRTKAEKLCAKQEAERRARLLDGAMQENRQDS